MVNSFNLDPGLKSMDVACHPRVELVFVLNGVLKLAPNSCVAWLVNLCRGAPMARAIRCRLAKLSACASKMSLIEGGSLQI